MPAVNKGMQRKTIVVTLMRDAVETVEYWKIISRGIIDKASIFRTHENVMRRCAEVFSWRCSQDRATGGPAEPHPTCGHSLRFWRLPPISMQSARINGPVERRRRRQCTQPAAPRPSVAHTSGGTTLDHGLPAA